VAVGWAPARRAKLSASVLRIPAILPRAAGAGPPDSASPADRVALSSGRTEIPAGPPAVAVLTIVGSARGPRPAPLARANPLARRRLPPPPPADQLVNAGDAATAREWNRCSPLSASPAGSLRSGLLEGDWISSRMRSSSRAAGAEEAIPRPVSMRNTAWYAARLRHPPPASALVAALEKSCEPPRPAPWAVGRSGARWAARFRRGRLCVRFAFPIFLLSGSNFADSRRKFRRQGESEDCEPIQTMADQNGTRMSRGRSPQQLRGSDGPWRLVLSLSSPRIRRTSGSGPMALRRQTVLPAAHDGRRRRVSLAGRP